MEGDGVQVSVESSWNVVQGSLNKSVIVVFLDPETHDPIISTSSDASEKLVLAPPTESVPCEITVTFQGRLCLVQSFYTLSTARICELYSQSTKTDRNYICTVKGWIPYENSCFSGECSEVIPEAADVMTHSNAMHRSGSVEENIDGSVFSSVGSSTVALNSPVDVKSVYSSSDDSWVDVRLHGSLTDENACVSLTAPECDYGNVSLTERELANLEDQMVLGRPRLNANPKDTGVEGDTNLDECFDKEHLMQGNATQDLFEAELELVDHSPWAAITIRLLSLQNKSLVEVNQMVFLAVAGPLPEPVSPCRSADQGANSLFAMFVPSMLQMARGVSGNSRSLLNCESSSFLCEQAQDMIEKLPEEKMSRSCEAPPAGKVGKLPVEAEKFCKTSLQNAVAEEGSVQQDGEDPIAHVRTREACAASKAGSLLNMGGGDEEISHYYEQISHYYELNGAVSKRTEEIRENQESSQQGNLHRAEWKTPAEMGRDQGISQQSYFNESESKREVEVGEQPFRSDSKSCNCKKSAGDFVANDLLAKLETFSERFDRLESVCLRMESYLHRTFENLDQRIKHLEVQHIRGSDEEADCVSASLKQSSMSSEVHVKEESAPSVVQNVAPSDLPPRAECKGEVLVSLMESTEPEFSEEQVFNEAPIPIVFDEVPIPTLFDVVNSGSAEEEKLFKEVPLENQEESRGPATMVGSTSSQSRKPRAFLDEAWASALSAFASSFTPVVGAENAAANQVVSEALGTPNAPSVLISQECGTPREARTSTEVSSRDDVEANSGNLKSDAAKFEDGLVYEDCVQALCDDQMMTGHAFPIDISSERPDHVPSGTPSKVTTLVPDNMFDLLGLKDIQSMTSKARTEGTDLISKQGLPGPTSEDGLSACLLFDIFASSHSSSMSSREPLDSSPALRGFKAAVLPVFDSASSETQDADFFSLGSKEEIPSKREESRNLFHFEENNKDNLYDLGVETLPEGEQPSLLVSKALQAEENKKELIHTKNVMYPVDFILRDKGKVLNMSNVQDPESFNSSFITYCELEGAASFPDVLEEDCSNYQDGRACSEDSLCFSQDFDICPNELCDADEWSCAANVFYLTDPELTDDEANTAVEERIEMSDISDTDSTEDLLFWPATHNESAVLNGRIDLQQQPMTVFPGFENLP